MVLPYISYYIERRLPSIVAVRELANAVTAIELLAN